MKQNRPWLSLFFFIVLCLVLEIFASYWTSETVSTWYPHLNKPTWTPPGWIFGPVWTLLYIMIALSGWLIYTAEHSPQRSIALVCYGLQLLFNFMWSFFFFSLMNPLYGLIDIILLSLTIILTVVKAWPVRRLASILLIPYLIWVIFATMLNTAIWILNG